MEELLFPRLSEQELRIFDPLGQIVRDEQQVRATTDAQRPPHLSTERRPTTTFPSSHSGPLRLTTLYYWTSHFTRERAFFPCGPGPRDTLPLLFLAAGAAGYPQSVHLFLLSTTTLGASVGGVHNVSIFLERGIAGSSGRTGCLCFPGRDGDSGNRTKKVR